MPAHAVLTELQAAFLQAAITAGLAVLCSILYFRFHKPYFLWWSLAWTLYQRGVVQTDYGLSTTMGVVLLALAFLVSYFSLRGSRGALVD